MRRAVCRARSPTRLAQHDSAKCTPSIISAARPAPTANARRSVCNVLGNLAHCRADPFLRRERAPTTLFWLMYLQGDPKLSEFLAERPIPCHTGRLE